jgi:hypothetical protein
MEKNVKRVFSPHKPECQFPEQSGVITIPSNDFLLCDNNMDAKLALALPIVINDVLETISF